MKKFGIRTDGIELEIESLFKNYLSQNKDHFRYYEIGAAGCITLRAITDIVIENVQHRNWIVDGLDLVNGYSLNWEEINSVFDQRSLQVFTEGISNLNYLNPPKTRLLLWENPRIYSKSLDENSLDIVFIDGNHNKENVMEDFLSIESKVKQNGIVLFHDFSEYEQNTDPQVGGGFIEVRSACQDLGLLNNSRSGWNFIKEIPGSRAWGGDGNGVGVFRKL